MTPAVQTPDLTAVIAAAELDIASLQEERSRLSLNVVRKLAGADTDYADCEARLLAAQRVLAQAHDAKAALDVEEAAAQEVVHAAEREKLVAGSAKADKKLDGHLATVEAAVQALVEVIKPALAAADASYNARLALGHAWGTSTAIRDRIEHRIAHMLRLEAGLANFDLGPPSARTPLDVELAPATPTPDYYRPPRDRKDIRAEPSYPGQHWSGRKILQSFLKDDNGGWVEVPVGTTELPSEGPA